MVNTKLGRLPRATRFGEIWHMDFFTMENAISGKQGNYFLVAKDDFTHYINIFHVHNTSGSVVAESIAQIISTFGKPNMIMFDGGSHFTNRVVSKLCKDMHMTQRFSIPYVHRSHGKVERANQSILKACKAIMSELRILKSEWFKLKDVIQSVINNTPIRDVGKTPIEIVFGKRDTSVLDYLGNNKVEAVSELDIDQWKTEHVKLIAEFKKDLDDIHESISIGNNREELEQNIHKLTIGDFVVYGEPICKKTEFAWKGPYQVVNLDSPHIITLREAGIANDMEDIKAHISRVRYLHDKNLEYNISWNEQSLWLDDEYILANIDSIYKKGQDYFTRTKWNTTDGKRYLYRDIKLDDFQKVYPREILKYLQLHLEDDIIRDLLDGWDMPDLQVT